MGKEQSGKKKLLYQPPITLLDEADMEMDEAFEILNSTPLNSESADLNSESADFQGNLLPAPVEPTGDMNMQKVISYLQNLQNSDFQQEILQRENERLKKQLRDLEAENNTLQKQVAKLEDNSVTMQEDYETLMKILNRARKLVLFDEEETPPTSFKMDRNGNLEKMAE